MTAEILAEYVTIYSQISYGLTKISSLISARLMRASCIVGISLWIPPGSFTDWRGDELSVEYFIPFLLLIVLEECFKNLYRKRADLKKCDPEILKWEDMWLGFKIQRDVMKWASEQVFSAKWKKKFNKDIGELQQWEQKAFCSWEYSRIGKKNLYCSPLKILTYI